MLSAKFGANLIGIQICVFRGGLFGLGFNLLTLEDRVELPRFRGRASRGRGEHESGPPRRGSCGEPGTTRGPGGTLEPSDPGEKVPGVPDEVPGIAVALIRVGESA